VMNDFDLLPLFPEIFMALMAMGLLIVGVIQGNESTGVVSTAAILGLAIAGVLLLGIGWEDRQVMNGMFKIDQFTGFMKLIVLVGLGASLALSFKYLAQEGMERFEYPVLVLLSGVGMMVMMSANNFLSLYMGLELQSLSLYVLAAFHRFSTRSSEAGIKYFILGALSSGMLLFGISLLYGFSGTIDFDVFAQTIRGMTIIPLHTIPLGVTFGLVFVLAGLAFKISAAPFHMWTPDVYQGAPTTVTAFFAMVPKIAAFAILMRLLFEPFGGLSAQWIQIVMALAVLSMLVGAFAGIAQDNIKRLLAYSSIGNMGYALVGLVAGTPQGAGAVILYLLIYMIMTAGVFAVVLTMRRNGIALSKIKDLSGLSKTSPALAYSLCLMMFSMSGIPPAAGFFGKLLVFNAAVASGYYGLAIFGVLTSVVAAFYYLRVIKVMFFDAAEEPFDTDMPFARRVVLLLSVLFVLGFVLKPSLLVDSTMSAVSVLFHNG